MPPTFLLYVATLLLAGLAPLVLVAGAGVALASKALRYPVLRMFRIASLCAAIVGGVAFAVAWAVAGKPTEALGMPLVPACAAFSSVAAVQGVALLRRQRHLPQTTRASSPLS